MKKNKLMKLKAIVAVCFVFLVSGAVVGLVSSQAPAMLNEANLCDPNPCNQPNQSMCLSLQGIAYCFCDPGYEFDIGGDCVSPGFATTPCDPNPCSESNKSICIVTNTMPVCLCDEDYVPDGDACVPVVLEVSIDIQPNSYPNSINPGRSGVISVAILTTDDFDATTVDPLSVWLGSDGAEEAHGQGHIEDVDDDGDLDLVLHFRTQETGITCGDTEAILTGVTFDDQEIEGYDSVNIVKCS